MLGKDAKVDVAVLRVKPDKPLTAVKFADSDKSRVGDWVLAVGNPFGLGGSVTAGIVSARNRNIDSGPYDNYIQTDAAINKGNSGGPLFNMDGEVIGINTAILSPSGGSIGIGFATPANTVVPIIEQLQKFGETRRGWLGVRIQNVDDSIAESLNLGKARGALIAGVDDKGPAKPAGLKAGDVIVKFDGKTVDQSRDLPKIVASTPIGKDVEVIVVRDGKEQTRTVKLGRLEDGEKIVNVKGGSSRDDDQSDSAVKSALGMDFATLGDDARAKFQIKDAVKSGVVITRVDPFLKRRRKADSGRRGDRRDQPEADRQARRRAGRDQGAEEGRQEVRALAGGERVGRSEIRSGDDRLRLLLLPRRGRRQMHIFRKRFRTSANSAWRSASSAIVCVPRPSSTSRFVFARVSSGKILFAIEGGVSASHSPITISTGHSILPGSHVGAFFIQ